MKRRRVPAALLALALAASACGADDDEAALVTTTTSPDGGAAGAVFVFEPVIEQVKCPGFIDRSGLACGVVEILLDRDDPDAGTTTISIATLAGSGDGGGAGVAVLQGGPGGASTDMAAWLPGQPFTQVFIDQRGTGFAAVDLACPEFDEALPDMLEAVAADHDAVGQAALDACATRLGDETLIDHTDSAAHAHDVAEVMLALGYLDQWFVYGVSYGSTIGLELLREDRAGLAGVVLDGVYPPSLDLDRAVAGSAQSSIDAIAAACGASERCAGFTDDFAGELDALVAQLDASPRAVPLDAGESGFGESVEVLLDGRRLTELAFLMLYSETQIAGLPAAVAAIADGDADATHWLVATASRTLASAYGANDEGTFYAVQCHERAPVATGLDAAVEGFAGAVVSTSLAEGCPVWDRTPADAASILAPIESDLPVLLLSGEFDPITPAYYAEDIAAGLANGRVVTQQGRSHGIWIGNACIQGIVADFIADPSGSIDDCADKPVPVDWFSPG